MNHILSDWKQIAKFVNEIPIIDCSPLRWYNDNGELLSPDELINMGYWGIRPPIVPSEYNPNINKLIEVELKDCEMDYDKHIIIQSYKIVDLTDDELSKIARKKRDILLQQTDKFVYPDIWEDLSQERKDALKSYRKKLRDIPYQDEFPRNIEWPILVNTLPKPDINTVVISSGSYLQPPIVIQDET